MGYKIKEETLEGIADAIRAKSGLSGDIQTEQFAQAILDLNVGENTDEAAESARAAASSAASASSSALAAAESAGESANSATDALKSEEAAAASADAAAKSASAAAESEKAAAESEFSAEAWAIGTRKGVDVESDDETYNNNAKYWAYYTKELVTVKDFTDDEMQAVWDSIILSDPGETSLNSIQGSDKKNKTVL